MKESKGFLLFHVFLFFLCSSRAIDKLTPGKTLRGNETLVSAGGMFELGFFTKHNLRFQYLGIWFKNDRNRKPVWVANRESPLLDFTGVLSLRHDDGNLVMTDVTTIPYFVNNGAPAKSNDTSAQILNSGNLILLEAGKIIWQSFNHPTDTLLPGMELGQFNINTDNFRIQYLSSWKNLSDPNTGFYSLGLSTTNTTKFNLWRLDSAYQQIGFWDGYEFRFFFQTTSSDNHYKFTYVSNSENISLTFLNTGNYRVTWFVVDSDGSIIEFRMEGEVISSVNHSVCDANMPHNSTGCLIFSPTKCKDGDDFSYTTGLVPTSMLAGFLAITSPSDCELVCRSNCSCVAYVSMNDNGFGCEIFYGKKVDLLNNIRIGNDTIYVRGDASKPDNQRKRILLLIPIVLLIALLFVLLIKLFCGSSRNFNWSGNNRRSPRSYQEFQPSLTSQLSTNNDYSRADVIEFSTKKDHELPLLSFSSIVAATDNFSIQNKIGQGGFGPVYKGKLQGHDIAVKRLSKYSGQGLVEFRNEVELISKLQHRNLVKLLGCCIEGEEKILIYEYMSNKSLDSFIFDEVKGSPLDWINRKHIITGIAQGLLYLHKYSRIRIIHRDLKTSNILLDDDMNPKISDFGMARILLESEFRTKTHRVVGTYGYMSPEYAVHGLYSTKSDVFSFGVILLEIVSGRKNATFEEPNSSMNLLGYAWDSLNGGRCMELMDPTMDATFSVDEIMLFIQVGLLCVQEDAEDRPSMSDVISMISNERMSLPKPKKPAYSTLLNAADGLISGEKTPSQNLVTISVVEAR